MDLPEAMREALCVFEALRRLGVPSDDIFMARGSDELVTSVQKNGKELFAFRVGDFMSRDEMSNIEFNKLWERACNWWNTGPKIADQWYKKSKIHIFAEKLATATVLHGYKSEGMI
ncbi:hypothetical protein LCGC14_0146150 [marine sediment metagenome]|uniref:Uncharacterized protein n=1 Tax=marine sediment metagenome TaxID=412755 RepID=A0A0F9V3E4_9ZZZZ